MPLFGVDPVGSAKIVSPELTMIENVALGAVVQVGGWVAPVPGT